MPDPKWSDEEPPFAYFIEKQPYSIRTRLLDKSFIKEIL